MYLVQLVHWPSWVMCCPHVALKDHFTATCYPLATGNLKALSPQRLCFRNILLKVPFAHTTAFSIQPMAGSVRSEVDTSSQDFPQFWSTKRSHWQERSEKSMESKRKLIFSSQGWNKYLNHTTFHLAPSKPCLKKIRRRNWSCSGKKQHLNNKPRRELKWWINS